MRQGWETFKSGDKYHYVNDKLHSINDEPSAIYNDGSKSWHKEGFRHREIGAAYISTNDQKAYWFEGIWYPKITSDLEWLMKVEELKRI